MKYCFLDLETTGLEHDYDSILEVSFVVTDETLKEIMRFDELILPTKTPLTPFVTNLTGITQDEIEKNGKSWETVKKDILEKIGDATIIGHNIDFDIQFLRENEIPLQNNKRIDTHELMRILFPGEESYSLEAITYAYNISHENAHRAMADVEACIQLWPILLEKVKELPREAIPDFDAFFANSQWAAGTLFLQLCGTKKPDTFYTKNEKNNGKQALPEIDEKTIQKIESEHTTFLRAGNTGETARWITQLGKKSKGSFLIIAPELSFFPEAQQLPTPSVIFDAKRHLQFKNSRKQFSDIETTFWLQCAVRNWLGYRGVAFFDLYLHQRDMWNEVNLCSPEDSLFQEILTERKNEKILACTPAAWCELCDLQIVQERKLIVFEAEIFAEKLLFAPSKTISLMKWLDEKETSNATHFFIARFVREELERLLNRQISTFPERELIPTGARYGEFATAVREISTELEELAQWLSTPEEELVRWVSYFPDTGNLVFGTWKRNDWIALREKFKTQSSLLCIRHDGGESNAFCRVFLGSQEGYFVKTPELAKKSAIEIPKDLVSSKSPDFNNFCREKITEIAEERCSADHWIAASFSSLASLKHIGGALLENPPKNYSVLGEKLAGGDSKLIGNIAKQTQLVLLLQKLQSPAVEDFPFKTFIVQKFPFRPSQPLFKHLEKEWNSSQLSFWDNWIVPTVAARLARTVAQFAKVEKIIVIDPAENSAWGKNVLAQAFPAAYAKNEKLF